MFLERTTQRGLTRNSISPSRWACRTTWLPTTPTTWSRSFHTTLFCRKQICGIVGLPNVGKSLLFNALMGKAIARSENFPFCTIDPNIATTFFHDPRLIKLCKIIKPKKVTPIELEFKDIAGLVQGASDGKGLGNQFLEHIRNVDMIIQLIRCFELETVSHVMDSIDPIRDIQIIEAELIQKDIQSLDTIKRGKKKGTKFDPNSLNKLAERVSDALVNGETISSLGIVYGHPDYEMLSSFNLLSSKPVLYVANVDESCAATGNVFSKRVQDWLLESRNCNHFVLTSAKLEFDLSIIEDQEVKKEFMEGYGITQSSIEKIIAKSFELLNLQVFYTMGKKEVRAWPVERGSTARQCAGKIHSDFTAGFIKAERWNVDDYINTNGVGYKKDNKGGDYITQEGDCYEFKVRC